MITTGPLPPTPLSPVGLNMTRLPPAVPGQDQAGMNQMQVQALGGPQRLGPPVPAPQATPGVGFGGGPTAMPPVNFGGGPAAAPPGARQPPVVPQHPQRHSGTADDQGYMAALQRMQRAKNPAYHGFRQPTQPGAQPLPPPQKLGPPVTPGA